MANTSVSFSNLDFDEYKTSLKTYLRSQERFKDYDFEGSNMSVLLDILAYNTMNSAFYLNMVSNEMFLDSAQLRDSVVSHAKELNYVPRSYRSAEAVIDIEIRSSSKDKTSILIPKGTAFSTRVGNRSFIFSTIENVLISPVFDQVSNQNVFTAKNVSIFEGDIAVDNFFYTKGTNTRFVLSNRNIDTSSIAVTVIEDAGANVLGYRRANSLYGVNQNSAVYFIQGAENERYEIVFGDGITGRLPKSNSNIVVEYRVSNGELPNGAFEFRPTGSIDGETNIRVVTRTSAIGGSVAESVESIKFNAPRHFTSQDRAVTSEDYENLIRQQFPEVNAVAAYGGEDLSPPQYGRVFVAIDLNGIDGLPNTKKDEYFKYLKTRSPVSIDVRIISPEYLYVAVDTKVRYNINSTQLNSDDIKNLVVSSILEYSNISLSSFNKTLRYSRLVSAIDDSNFSVVSNETKIRLIKYMNTTDFSGVKIIQFNAEIEKNRVTSTQFTYQRETCTIVDDGAGALNIVNSNGATVKNIGKVNYTSGVVELQPISITSQTGIVKLYCTPVSSDVSSIQNTILNIIEEDISVIVESIRE